MQNLASVKFLKVLIEQQAINPKGHGIFGEEPKKK